MKGPIAAIIFAAVIVALAVIVATRWVSATDPPCPPGQGLVYVQGARECRAVGQWVGRE